MFEKITDGAQTKYRHYIEDIAVVTTTETQTETTHNIGFTHRDRLGSTVAIGDEAGLLKETHSFDPFGKPRPGNITDKLPSILDSQFTTRGFTDHEHLDDVQLIHMNGRAYDYNLGRFLSVDPVIQAPGNSQSLNPYSYIMNNPLAGTDPSGYVGCDVDSPGDCNDVADSLGDGEKADITQKQTVTGSRIQRNVKVGTMTGNGNGSVSVETGAGSFTASTDIGGQAGRENIAGLGQGGIESSNVGDSNIEGGFQNANFSIGIGEVADLSALANELNDDFARDAKFLRTTMKENKENKNNGLLIAALINLGYLDRNSIDSYRFLLDKNPSNNSELNAMADVVMAGLRSGWAQKHIKTIANQYGNLQWKYFTGGGKFDPKTQLKNQVRNIIYHKNDTPEARRKIYEAVYDVVETGVTKL